MINLRFNCCASCVVGKTVAASVAGLSTILLIVGCGGGGGNDASTVAPAYSVGGTVVGLSSGDQLVISNNGAETLAVGEDGAFAFPSQITLNQSYLVSVVSSPTGKDCQVSRGAGIVSAAHLAVVAINCTTRSFQVAGQLSGLAPGTQIVLSNNGNEQLTLVANGAFAFATSILYGANYSASIFVRPTNQKCSIQNGANAVVVSAVNNVLVSCEAAVPTTLVAEAAVLHTAIQGRSHFFEYRVKVLDADGNPFVGLPVTFSASSDYGLANPKVESSDSEGIVRPLAIFLGNPVNWLLLWMEYFYSPGLQHVYVTATGLAPLTFDIDVVPSSHKYDGQYICPFDATSLRMNIVDGVLSIDTIGGGSLNESTGGLIWSSGSIFQRQLSGVITVDPSNQATLSGTYGSFTGGVPIGPSSPWGCTRL